MPRNLGFGFSVYPPLQRRRDCRYCSPAVDLSFFLFLNTTPSQRSLHWDDFFVAYYDGLTTAMRGLLSSGPDMSPTMGE